MLAIIYVITRQKLIVSNSLVNLMFNGIKPHHGRRFEKSMTGCKSIQRTRNAHTH